MKTYSIAVAAALTLSLALGGTAAANQIAGVLVTGTLTAPPANDYIKVDGHNYHIRAGSTAANDVRSVTQGQRVDVRLRRPVRRVSAADVAEVLQLGEI